MRIDTKLEAKGISAALYLRTSTKDQTSRTSALSCASSQRPWNGPTSPSTPTRNPASRAPNIASCGVAA